MLNSQNIEFYILRINNISLFLQHELKTKQMLVTFNEDYLEDLYRKGTTKDKKHRYQPQVIRGYQKAIKFLIQAKRKEDLFPFKSLNFEALHGNKEGFYSVRANGQYRVEFTINESNGEPMISICNVLDLSNHYK